MIDVHRIVPDDIRDKIRAELGVEWAGDQITVADVIIGQAGIGYGGHFDETSEDEEAIYAMVALDDAELAEIQAARHHYTGLLSDAIDAVAWPADDSRTESLRRALLRCAKRVYMDSNDWEITRLQEALDESLALLPFDIDHDRIDAEALAWARRRNLA